VLDANRPQGDVLFPDEIAEVNLLAEQGRYSRAIALCQRLLNQHPTSAPLYEAMGDILRRRSDWQGAASSYETSLELSSDDEVLAKLADARRRIAEAGGLRTPLPVEEAEERPRLSQRMKLALLGAATVFVVLVVVVLVRAGRPGPGPQVTPVGAELRPGTARTAPAQPGAVSPERQQIAVRTAPGSYGSSHGAEWLAPKNSGAVTPSAPAPQPPTTPIRITTEIRAPQSDRDFYIARAVSSLSWPDGESMSGKAFAMFDPATGYAMITFETPDDIERQGLFTTVVRQAYAAAQAAIKQEPGLQSMTIRCLTKYSAQDKTVTDVAFRGNTSRLTLEAWGRRTPPTTQELWGQVFASSWWNPTIQTG